MNPLSPNNKIFSTIVYIIITLACFILFIGIFDSIPFLLRFLFLGVFLLIFFMIYRRYQNIFNLYYDTDYLYLKKSNHEIRKIKLKDIKRVVLGNRQMKILGYTVLCYKLDYENGFSIVNTVLFWTGTYTVIDDFSEAVKNSSLEKLISDNYYS